MTKSLFWLLAGLLFVLSCNSKTGGDQANLEENRFTDPVLRKIHDHQDHRYLDSLSVYFSDPNPLYRREAALACASMQDAPALPFLTDLLNDADPSVAAAAAYALGQTGDETADKALRLAIALPDSAWKRGNGIFFGSVLEALGKLGSDLDLEYVIYQYSELGLDASSLPLVKSLYQFSSRNIVSRDAEEFLSDVILDGLDPKGAVLAANAFARRKELAPEVLLEGVLEDFEHETNADIRMNIARAIRHIGPELGNPMLLKLALNPKEDYRVRVNAINAYKAMPDSSAFEALPPLLEDRNLHIAHVAASAIRINLLPSESQSYLESARSATEPGIRGELFRAAVKAEFEKGKAKDASDVVMEALNALAPTQNHSEQYEKGLYLIALSEDPANIPFLFDQVLTAQNPVIKGYAMTGLLIAFPLKGAPKAEERLDMLRQAIATGDAAVQSLVSYELSREDAGYTEDMDYSFLEKAMEDIKLPEGIEAYRYLQDALQKLTGKQKRLKFPEYNHPIDWKTIARISPGASASIKTNRGDITFELFVDETPATVANFVELVESGFYEGKFFHRVVPNFVIQTGCPRGDGYGSPPHSIRSEFPDLHYGTGAVGMASAGRDTESSQFFITHSPTPHLNGRYTLFGQVTAGMDVVHQIQVGDFIERISLQGVAAK